MGRGLVFLVLLILLQFVFADECVPIADYEVDIVCASTNIPLECGKYINYQISQDLDVDAVSKKVHTSIESTKQWKNVSYQKDACIEARTILSCALAFPKCTGESYVNFPCKDVCLNYYNQCEGSDHLGSCDVFPDSDCVTLSDLKA